MILAFKRLVIGLICVIAGLSSAVAAPLPPDQLVKQTIDEVLSIIRSDERIQSGDVARIAEVMEEKSRHTLIFPRMTRLAVGRPWRQATPEQRRALVNEFHTLLIRSYANAFTMFNAIFVEYRPLRKSDEETEATVNTLIRLPGGAQPISVDYQMKLKEDAWLVYDVSVVVPA